MAQEIDPPAERITDAMAYVCRQLDYLRAVISRHQHWDGEGDPPILRQVLNAFRQDDPARPLQELHTALQAAGDPLGVWGNTRSLRLTGVEDGGAGELVYLCPGPLERRCSRYQWPEASIGPPRCEVLRAPMRRDRL